MTFDSLGLAEPLLRALQEQGYSEPTPIQSGVIPLILDGRDVVASAQTGTGKTASFTLPILQHLLSEPSKPGPHKNDRRQLRALILTPTRELAAQIGENILAYSRYLDIRSTTVFGGVNINPQTQALKRGTDILVATPGRLLDHVGQGHIDLSTVSHFVLDEADRMLDMGFIHDVKRVLALLSDNTQRQNMLFSATYSASIRQLAERFLNKPEVVDVAPQNSTADRIEQVVHPVDKPRKRELLSHLIRGNQWSQVLVFTRTKHGANRLVKQLTTDGICSAAIHGNKSQAARTRALSEFKEGKVSVLVATDIAARGLDIAQLPHVVNYELPNVPEDYIHRIGRTARAGHAGVAVSLVCAEELSLLRNIERLLKREVEKVVFEGYEPTENPADVTPINQKARNAARKSDGRKRQSGQRRQGGSRSQSGQRQSGQRQSGQRQSGSRSGRGGAVASS